MMDYGIIVPMNGRNYPDRCKIAAKLQKNFAGKGFYFPLRVLK